MPGNKFDYQVADTLVEAVNRTADMLDVQCGQMEKRFGALQEYFKDEGYAAFSGDMSGANTALSNVSSQLKQVGKKIKEYSQKLKEVQ